MKTTPNLFSVALGPSATLLWLCLSAAPAAVVRYVNVNNASPAPPYISWVTDLIRCRLDFIGQHIVWNVI
jgi:hypothetical protein